jgi:hypothetical protein
MRRVTVAMSQVRDDAGGRDVAADGKAADQAGGLHELADASSVPHPLVARVFGVEPDVAAIVLVYFGALPPPLPPGLLPPRR